MENIYTSNIAYSAIDKVIKLTGFTELQNFFLTNALSNCNKILDLAMGFGNVAKVLLENGKDVYRIDSSKIAFDYSKKNIGKELTERLKLIRGDFMRLPFNSEFDGVCCESNFGAEGAKLVIPEAYRALKNGGIFAVTMVEDQKLARERTNKEMEKKGINYVLSNFTQEELEFLRGIEGRTFGEGDELPSYELMRMAGKHGFETKSVVPFYDEAFYCLVMQKGN